MIQTERDYSVDRVKGICIILMVIGHSGCPEALSRWIYLFHMPAFFFISGYLFSLKYIENKRLFIVKRLKTLYLPFVLYSLFFLAVHNVLASLHVYSNSYSYQEILKKTLQIITLTGSEQLLGGFWFLKELLYASIISLFIVWMCAILEYSWRKQELTGVTAFARGVSGRMLCFLILSVLLVLVICTLYSLSPYHIPAINSKTLLASAYFLSGFVAKKMRLSLSGIYKLLPLVVLALLGLFSRFYSFSIDTTGYEVFPAFMIGILGSVSLLFLCKMEDHKKSILVLTGQNSMDILIWHFSCFKVVTLFIILVYGWDIAKLSVFPVFSMSGSVWWIFYAIIGVSLPIVLKSIVNESRRYYSKL